MEMSVGLIFPLEIMAGLIMENVTCLVVTTTLSSVEAAKQILSMTSEI